MNGERFGRLPLLPILFMGCSDAGLKVHNSGPIASITQPFDGQRVVSGTSMTLTGVASDSDDPLNELEATWYVGAREACPAAVAAVDGATQCDAVVDSDTVRLEVRDPSGAVDTAGVTLALSGPVEDTGDGVAEDSGDPAGDSGDPPVDLPLACVITAPTDGASVDPYEALELVGSVVDPDTATAAVTARWTSSLDGVLSDVAPAADGGSTASALLTSGEHTVVLAGADDAGQTCSAEVQVTVRDRCPGLEVDGSGSQYAAAAGHTDFTADGTSLSVSAWVRWDGTTGQSFHPVASQGWGVDATSRFFVAIVGSSGLSACSAPDSPGLLHLELKVDGANVCLASDRPVPAGQWTHVAASFDSGTARIHINGMLDSSASFSGTTLRSVTPADVLLGASFTDGNLGFGGLLGGVHVRSQALAATDFTPAWPPASGGDTLGLWLLDDQQPVAVDSGPGGHDATLVDASWQTDCPDADADGDGFVAWQDCADTEAGIYPWAGDTLGDGIDTDCDGLDCEAVEVSGVYWAVCDEPGTWSEVRDTCQDAMYDDLAVFEPLSEASTAEGILQALGVACQVNSHACPWIGLYQSGGAWRWVDGSSPSDTNWASSEPTGDGGCVHMDRYGGGRWNDAPCEEPTGTFGMVCERVMVP